MAELGVPGERRRIRAGHYYDIAELALALGAPHETVRKWYTRGHLPPPDITLGTQDRPGWSAQSAEEIVEALRDRVAATNARRAAAAAPPDGQEPEPEPVIEEDDF